MPVRIILCLLAALVATAVPAGAAEPKPYGTQALVRLPDNRPGLMVVINERGPFLFLIDTATSHTVIVPRLRDRLALPPTATGPAFDVITASSTVRSRLHRVAEVAAAGVIVEGVQAVVIDLPDKIGIEGIIGADFLSNFTVDLNLPAQSITLYPDGSNVAPRGMTRITGQVNDYGFIVVPARIDNVGTAAVLDTGAQYTVANAILATQTQRQAKSVARNIENKVVDAAQKRSWADSQSVARIALGKVSWRDRQILISDMRVFQQIGLDRKPAAFLGMDLLAGRRIVMNYADASLWFKPDR